jgi:hypothetical protein
MNAVTRGVDPTRVPGLLAAHRSAIEDATN